MNRGIPITDEAVFAKICDLLVGLECIQKSREVRLSESLSHHLNVDSLELVELIMQLEKYFDVAIDDDIINRSFNGPKFELITVQYVVHLVMGRDPSNEESVTPVQCADEQVVVAP